ncbi:hypothetical protein H696_05518 [Fonticula alba]|uniref:Matrin-type domain-containing protein n=1 Tax=Fonticula alba TaxID=691883 RepID=A0A058Z3H1_FONAL|nr:hypothetical protein H696_05518 [Fonticula alba]KCV68052.1 hypothetical protein H696_05518 [Fonticula alba]|eukprot:XP_009497619.1 hypothetical protein H696_05518 [Fonticula alba]
MATIFEIQRQCLEEIDRLEQLIVDELAFPASTHEEQLLKNTRVAKFAQMAQEQSNLLLHYFKDADGMRLEETEQMAGGADSAQGALDEFYRQMRQIEDQHSLAAVPNALAESPAARFTELAATREKDMNDIIHSFTGEEGLARYLDLTKLHSMYLNLDFVREQMTTDRPAYLTYVQYLAEFDAFPDIPRAGKNAAYAEYVRELGDYLESFFRRAHPLVNVSAHLRSADEAFAVAWSQGAAPGWPRLDEDEQAPGPAGSAAPAPEEVAAAQARQSYCDLCRVVCDSPAGLQKHSRGTKHRNAARREERERECARLEARVTLLAQLLGQVRDQTRENVERKQTRTLAERELEAERAAQDAVAAGQATAATALGAGGSRARRPGATDAGASDDEDEHKPIYNPLNLPLDWDGRPIPVWLYRLHGLGVSYECEICGDFSYRGRRNFERHFMDWRHTQRLKCLGITNSKEFIDVTKIADAQALWKKIQQSRQLSSFRAEHDEEFEDSRGYVLNRRTYEDLRRQDLL